MGQGIPGISGSKSRNRSSQYSGVADWAKEDAQSFLSGLSQSFQAGDFAQIAGFSPEQRAGLAAATDVAGRQDELAEQGRTGVDTLQDLAAGEGAAFDRLKAARANDANLALGQQQAAAGPLAGGGSRFARQNAFAQSQLGHQLAKDQSANAQALGQAVAGNQLAQGQGANTLVQAGGLRQQQKQRELDAKLKGYQNAFGLFAQLPTQESTGSSLGKSKSAKIGGK